jgi:formiminotetrahydrofolate cyclodeaminase
MTPRFRRCLRSGAPALALLLTACGGGGSTAAFCEAWQASLDQLAVVADLDEGDPAYAIERQRMQELNTAAYDRAPANIREAAQELADLTSQKTPEELLDMSEQTDQLTDTILAYVEQSCRN